MSFISGQPTAQLSRLLKYLAHKYWIFKNIYIKNTPPATFCRLWKLFCSLSGPNVKWPKASAVGTELFWTSGWCLLPVSVPGGAAENFKIWSSALQKQHELFKLVEGLGKLAVTVEQNPVICPLSSLLVRVEISRCHKCCADGRKPNPQCLGQREAGLCSGCVTAPVLWSPGYWPNL